MEEAKSVGEAFKILLDRLRKTDLSPKETERPEGYGCLECKHYQRDVS